MSDLYEIIIEPKEAGQPRKRAGVVAKTREFGAFPLAHISADHLWSGGAANKETMRPVYLQLANSELAVRPVVLNLRLGQRAALFVHNPEFTYRGTARHYLELLKSGGYAHSYLKLTEGRSTSATSKMVATIYQTELFRQNAGALTEAQQVLFCALAPQWWVQQEQAVLAADQERLARIEAHFAALGGFQPQGETAPWPWAELADLIPWAVYSLSYLETRTSRPFVMTEAFYLQLFLAALQAKILTLAWPVDCGEREIKEWRTADAPTAGDRWWWAHSREQRGFTAWGLDAVGALAPVGCATTPDILDPFLAREVERYFQAQRRLDTKAAPVTDAAQRRRNSVLQLVNSGALTGRLN